MNLAEAQELLRSPRSLTQEQWRQAYETIQEHNHERLRKTLERSRDAAAPNDEPDRPHGWVSGPC